MSLQENAMTMSPQEEALEFELSEPVVTFRDQSPDFRAQVRDIVYEWFVRYNPLYFFSALCVLFGSYLVSQGLEGIGWLRGQVLLTAVIQLYEFLLIIAAALLFRKAAQDRAAVILGVMEVVFLFDCTFRTEVIATLDQVTATPGELGRMLGVIWVVLLGVKLLFLAWTFDLKPSKTAILVPVLAAVGIAWTSQELATAGANKEMIHLFATWFGVGLVALVALKRPAIPCRLKFDSWGQTVLRRALTAIWFVWLGLYFFHLFTWIHLFDIRVTVSHFVSLVLLVALLSKHEQLVWAGSVATLAVACLDPSTMSLTALAVGVVLGGQAWQLNQKRLYIGTVLALYLAAWTLNWQHWPLPEFNLWLSLAVAAILSLMAWRMKLPVALLPLLAGVYPATQIVTTMSMLERGISLLAVGFVALIVGVVINLSQRGHHSTTPN